MKILILGPMRAGKDTLAEILNREFGTTYTSSSEAANDIFIFDQLKVKYGYKNKKECFEDRVNHRSEWYKMICDYNQEDKTKLAKNILKKTNCYVGMRDYDEFKKSKHLFDIIIYVDADERVTLKDNTFNIPKSESDIVIENNTTLKDFETKVIKFGKLIYSKYD